MKRILVGLSSLMVCLGALANVEPNVNIISAGMRPGTTLMDVVYRIDDPDDATVKVRALAFIDGVRSFANVIRPATWEEGSEANLGDIITTGTEHTLTWNVAADWDIDLGNIKFEVLCRDSRELLTLEWLTIPAANGELELIISKNSPSNTEVLNALYWQHAGGDPAITVESGTLSGNANSGVFKGVQLASGTSVEAQATPYLLKQMDLAVSGLSAYAYFDARAPLTSYSPTKWYAENRSYNGVTPLFGWGDNNRGQATPPHGVANITGISAGYEHNLALTADGRVVGWGNNSSGQASPPSNLTNVTAIAAGYFHSLALKADGTVVAWGRNDNNQTSIPNGLDGVIAIAAGGSYHSLAVKSDGTVIGWGNNFAGQISVPTGLSNVTAVAAGGQHSLALKADGTVVAWGKNDRGQASVPSGLSDVVSIAARQDISLALRSNGTVVGWGWISYYGIPSPPSGLSDVTAVAAGSYHCIALKADGTIVAWGKGDDGRTSLPVGMCDISAIAAGGAHNIACKARAE
ncbi:hypothetical protein P4B35_01295 [Pontiellaceae bacterium B12227]|nr:hypothetical protein [Pontiellaceae bacterium B12227]